MLACVLELSDVVFPELLAALVVLLAAARPPALVAVSAVAIAVT